jgi:formyltetrahydrofolate synthetase
MSDVWATGGEGGEAVAREILAVLDEGKAKFAPTYDAALPIKAKIEAIARDIYGAEGVDYSPVADRAIILSQIKLSKLRVYATAQNLFTITNYSGYDPEIGSYNQDALITGVDNGRYPTPRLISIGCNIEF